jgi:hypothetical protein
MTFVTKSYDTGYCNKNILSCMMKAASMKIAEAAGAPPSTGASREVQREQQWQDHR